jgi:antitoxin HigA-1
VIKEKAPHPGAFIQAEILARFGLTITKWANLLGVSRPALSNLVKGRTDLSGDMALRIEKAFGIPMETLLRMQLAYDIARTRAANRIQVPRFRRVRVPPPTGQADVTALAALRLRRDWSYTELARRMTLAGFPMSLRSVHHVLHALQPHHRDRTLYKIGAFLKIALRVEKDTLKRSARRRRARVKARRRRRR